MEKLKINFNSVGIVKTPLSDDEVRDSWPNGVESNIEVFEEYADALDAIESFSHISVLFYFHKTTDEQRKLLKARPRRFLKYGWKMDELPVVGVFSLDSPHRPNPIGLTIVQLLQRKGNVLRVKGLDAFNGTPVLDMKPYKVESGTISVELPDWLKRLKSGAA